MAFFVPRKSEYQTGHGPSGKDYTFLKGTPTEVTEPRDVSKFRNQRDVLMEVDATAAPAEQPRASAEAQMVRAPSPSADGTLTSSELPKGTPKAAKTKVTRRARTT